MNRIKRIFASPRTDSLYIGLILILMVLFLSWQKGEMENWENDYRQVMDENAYAWYGLFRFNFSVFEELLNFPDGLTDEKEASLLRMRLDFWRRESEEPEMIRQVRRVSYGTGGAGMLIEEWGSGGFRLQEDPYWAGIAEKFLIGMKGNREYSFHTLSLEERGPCLIVSSEKRPVLYILELDEAVFFDDFLDRITKKVYQRKNNAFPGMVPAVLGFRGDHTLFYSLDGKGKKDQPYWVFPLSDIGLIPNEDHSPEGGIRPDLLPALEIENPFFIYYWLEKDPYPVGLFEEEDAPWEDLVDPDQKTLFFAYLPRNLSLEQIVLLRNIPFLLLGYFSLVVLGVSLLKLNRYNREKRALLIRQEEFVSSLSHELRTPLHIISNGADNLADGFIHKREDTVRYGKIMKQEAERLSGMIESILAYSGVSSQEPKREILELDILLEEILSPYRIFCREKGILLEEVFEKGLLYKGSREALKLILSNLLSNAIQYGASGGWIQVSVRLWEELVLSVRDRGPGVPKHEWDLITEPFYKGEQRGDEAGSSNGLGLSIVKRIAENEGGKLVLASIKGEGSTFSVYLPLLPVEDPEHV